MKLREGNVFNFIHRGDAVLGGAIFRGCRPERGFHDVPLDRTDPLPPIVCKRIVRILLECCPVCKCFLLRFIQQLKET